MLLDNKLAQNFAAKLLQIKAIKLQPDNPFTWASGWQSPIYCDNRLTLSYPELRTIIAAALAKGCNEKFAQTTVVAGVATAGIAHGILLAEQNKLPFIYVRSDAKKHGLQNRIEGKLEPGQQVLVVEDLISTGGSSLQAVQAIRDAGAEVVGLLALFTYGFQKSIDAFQDANCPFYTITDYSVAVQMAIQDGSIGQHQATLLSQWRESPETWGR